jgi:hypothetical protein
MNHSGRAMRTARDVDLRHTQHECIDGFNHRLVRFRCVQREPTGGQLLVLLAAGLVRVNYLDRSASIILTGEARWFFSSLP